METFKTAAEQVTEATGKECSHIDVIRGALTYCYGIHARKEVIVDVARELTRISEAEVSE